MNPQQPPIMQPGAAPPPPAAGPGPQVMPPAPSGSADKTNPNSTQNTLQLSEIRDGIVIMNDGTFRAVVACQAINFDLMSPDEREAVEYSYQGFLNSLYFPIQIFIRSQKIDLSPYLDRLSKLRNSQESMLLGVLMDDYIAFLSDIADRTNIMDKKFYIIIAYPDADADIRRSIKASTGFFTGMFDLFRPAKTPHVVIDESSLEKGKTELRNRINAVMQGLQQCGVSSVPLDTQELIELYYESYNPDTANNQRLGDAKDLNVPLISKGKGQAAAPNISEGPA
jgi:hypothetical protein